MQFRFNCEMSPVYSQMNDSIARYWCYLRGSRTAFTWFPWKTSDSRDRGGFGWLYLQLIILFLEMLMYEETTATAKAPLQTCTSSMLGCTSQTITFHSQVVCQGFCHSDDKFNQFICNSLFSGQQHSQVLGFKPTSHLEVIIQSTK